MTQWATRWRWQWRVGVLLTAALLWVAALWPVFWRGEAGGGAADAGGGAAGGARGGAGSVFDAADPGEVRARERARRFDSGHDRAVVLLDRGAAGEHAQKAERAAAALGRALEREAGAGNAFADVVWGIDTRGVSPRMLLTQPTATVRQATEGLQMLSPLLEAESPAAMLQQGLSLALREMAAVGAAPGSSVDTKRGGQAADVAEEQATQVAGGSTSDAVEASAFATGAAAFAAMLDAVAERLAQEQDAAGRGSDDASGVVDRGDRSAGPGALEERNDEASGWLMRMRRVVEGEPWQWLKTSSRRLMVVMVTLHAEGEDLGTVQGSQSYDGALDRLEAHVDAVAQRFPEVAMGFTGAAAVKREVEAKLRPAATRGGVAAIAVLLVFCGIVWRSVRLAAVLAGVMSWAAGVAVGGVAWGSLVWWGGMRSGVAGTVGRGLFSGVPPTVWLGVAMALGVTLLGVVAWLAALARDGSIDRVTRRRWRGERAVVAMLLGWGGLLVGVAWWGSSGEADPRALAWPGLMAWGAGIIWGVVVGGVAWWVVRPALAAALRPRDVADRAMAVVHERETDAAGLEAGPAEPGPSALLSEQERDERHEQDWPVDPRVAGAAGRGGLAGGGGGAASACCPVGDRSGGAYGSGGGAVARRQGVVAIFRSCG